MSLLSSMPFPIQFSLAFLVVLGLIAGTAWAVRRFGTGRLGNGAARGRQPRLGVVDHASIDGHRRLLIIRRDNVEHLVMIGGPTDVVVEANIVRGAAAARNVAITRIPVGAEALTRAIPLPDSAGNGSWPLSLSRLAEAFRALRVASRRSRLCGRWRRNPRNRRARTATHSARCTTNSQAAQFRCRAAASRRVRGRRRLNRVCQARSHP